MDDERVVVHLRAHASALLLPALALFVLAPVTGALLGRTEGPAAWAVGALAAVLAVRMVAWPFVRWWTTTYELTSRRASLRWGVLSRHGRDVPWRHVVDVALDRSVRQRLTGCGTVVLTTRRASPEDDTEVLLADVPQPERLWRAAADLAADAAEPAAAADTGDPGAEPGHRDGPDARAADPRRWGRR